MSIWVKLLIGFHSFWGGIGIVLFVLGNAFMAAPAIIVGYICSGMALAGKGGSTTRFIAKLANCVLSLGFLGAVYAVYLPIIGEPFESLLFFSCLMFGVAGVSTLANLPKPQKVEPSANT